MTSSLPRVRRPETCRTLHPEAAVTTPEKPEVTYSFGRLRGQIVEGLAPLVLLAVRYPRRQSHEMTVRIVGWRSHYVSTDLRVLPGGPY